MFTYGLLFMFIVHLFWKPFFLNIISVTLRTASSSPGEYIIRKSRPQK